MKFIKSLFIVAAIALLSVTTGCIKDPQFKPAQIGVNPQTIDLETEAAEVPVKLFSNRDWTLDVESTEGEVTWLMVSDTAGVAMTDSLTLTISITPNTGEDRQATINFRTETIYASVRVSQKGVIQKEYTPIPTVRALYQGSDVTITEDWIIKASVVSNYRNSEYGGLNNATSSKTMIVSDGTSGISLYLSENNTLYGVGDELAISLKGMKLQRYNNGSLQVNGLPLGNIEKLGTRVIEPLSITPAQLVTGNYESMYVAVSDVQVASADMDKTFATKESHTSLNFEAKTGEKFVLFSSKYSTFMDEKVPSGSGVLKGVAMVFGSTYQMSITAVTDYAALTGERFTVTGGGGGGEEGDGAVIGDYAKWNAISPVSEFGDNFINIKATKVAYENINWMFYSSDKAAVTNGWTTGIYNEDKYMQIAPYASELTEVTAYALIPRINVSAAAAKELKFKIALYYKTADASKLEIVTSENFEGDFSKATWTVLQDVSFAADAEMNTWVEKKVDLSSFAAKTSLCVAFRYTGKANTYRLDDVQFNNGKYPEEDGGGDGGDGGGGAGEGVYTSNVTMPAADFSDSDKAAYGGKAKIGGTEYPMLKLGKSSVIGTYTFAAPLPKTGSCTLSFYAVAWKGATTSITVTIDNGGKIDGATSKEFALTANAGATGNPPFTLTLGNDFYSAALTEITSASTITVTTSTTGFRAIMLGVNIK
jgi:hypothetical protein